MKAVIDTNVFISSFLSPAGAPRRIIDLWKTGHLEICLCAEILEEYVDVLSRFGLAGERELKELLDLFRTKIGIRFVAIENIVEAVQEDPADNKFIECAVKAAAEYIISGDKHLRKLGSYEGIVILSPNEFLERSYQI